MASESKQCPKCGGPIPAEAPQGLCPKCLLLEVSIPTEAGHSVHGKSTAPTREELASAFPHLEIIELIGQGGMGFVFKARQPKLNRLVALKILPQSMGSDPAFAERFTREGRALARLNHPNIVTVYDFGQANGFFYLLMEFVDGVNLRQAMKAGRFTPDQALAIVPKICEALQYAHGEGILHRDIKPDNILLDVKGRVKIVDFGIAKLAGDPFREGALTASGAALGTPHYMAPEQIEKPDEVDHRADIFSLGVVFYEMLTGELPLGRFPPPSEKSTADPRLDDVVLRTLEKDKERRPRTAGEVKTQVETIAQSPGQAIPRHAPTPQVSKTDSKPKRLGKVLVSLAAIMVLLPIMYFFLGKRQGETQDTPSAHQISKPPELTKTIFLTGATNELVNHSNAWRRLFVMTESHLLPGESIVAVRKWPDGRFKDEGVGFFVHRNSKSVSMSSLFSWRFSDSFGDEEAQLAFPQLYSKTERPIVLTSGRRFELFSVTNRFGAVMSGYLYYKRELPKPRAPGEEVAATIRVHSHAGWPSIDYSAEVPPGYALQASANLGEVHETLSARTDVDAHVTWFMPSSFSHDPRENWRALDAAKTAQLEQLVRQGPMTITLGERRVLFALTNSRNEVFRAFMELVGPPGETE